MFCDGIALCCTPADVDRLTWVGLGSGLLIRRPLREAASRAVGDIVILREHAESLRARLDAESAARAKAEAENAALRQKMGVLEAQAKSREDLLRQAFVRKEFYKGEYAKAWAVLDGVVKALGQGKVQPPPSSPDTTGHTPGTGTQPPPEASPGGGTAATA